MKTASTLLCALFASILLSGCGGDETPSTETQAAAPSSEAKPAAEAAPAPAAAVAANENVVVGKDNWLFLPGELDFLSKSTFWGEAAATTSKASKPDWADPLPAITEFHNALAAKGIELLLVPVPAKGQIYADKLPEGSKQPMTAALKEFYAKLGAAGVQVMDLTDDFMAAKATTAMHCQTDTHWTPAAIEMTADKIHDHAAASDWAKAITPQTFVSEAATLSYKGDLTVLGELDLPPEELTVNRIGTKAGSELTPLENDADSPILVMGDSHTLFCHEASLVTNGGGLSDQLAKRFGTGIDLIGMRGSASSATRITLLTNEIKANKAGGSWLGKKKLIVWCFAARELTQSTGGWRVLPIEKK